MNVIILKVAKMKESSDNEIDGNLKDQERRLKVYGDVMGKDEYYCMLEGEQWEWKYN